MEYAIQNKYLKIVISSIGAEIQSIKGNGGTEYLWQGDKCTWPNRAPNIFPYVARLTNGKYKYRGKTYKMETHGFLPKAELKVYGMKNHSISFQLTSNKITRKYYPFEFTYLLHYKLDGPKLLITYEIRNEGMEAMYFGLGGHPGFCIPNEANFKFTDYFLEFEKKSIPKQIEMTDDCFVTGLEKVFPLREQKYLDLRHDLFDHDAVILRKMCKKVTLKSKKGKKEVIIEFQQMNYLGIWHCPRAEINFICIEPWTSLPSRDGIVEDIEKQENLVKLLMGEKYTNQWSIAIKE